MKGAKVKICHIALLIFFTVIAINCHADTNNLDSQERALKIIGDFAERLCTIPLKGKANNLELSGNFQVELNKLIKQLANLGINGAAKYQSSKWQGVLQKDIAGLVKKKIDCKREVFKELQDKFLTSVNQELPQSKYAGKLTPRAKTLLSAREKVYPQLELGDGGAIFNYRGPVGEPMFNIFEDGLTVISDKGQIKVSTIIRNKNGVIVAELINNEWKINKDGSVSFDRNYSKDAIEVKDGTGDIVLQVRVLDDRIQLQGKFYDSKGNGVGMGKHPSGKGGVMEKTSPKNPQLTLKIDPIFKYPSDNHLGELRDSQL